MIKINLFNFYIGLYMDNQIEYLRKVVNDLKNEILQLRLQNVDIQTQMRMYKHHAEQLEGQLIMLKNLMDQ